jgi:tripartite-type tricarboxylate transporter receptor subunit TctC
MRSAALALALLCAHGPAFAQGASYPARPIHLVVGFPAGGASDVAARALAQKMSERMGRPMIVDNRPGAASNIGADQVAKSAADGYTVLFGTISLAINPGLYPKLSYDPLKDLAAVSQVSSAPFLLVVNPKSPVNSVGELLALAKSKTGQAKLDYATAGNGSGSHLFMELFASLAGIQLSHIPYKGAAPAMNDVLGGQVPLTFDNIITTLPLTKAGRLRALAVSSAQRSRAAPDIPTLSEAGVPGYDATSWFGLFVPAGTPPDIINRLYGETAEALKDAKVRDALLAVGSEPVGSSPQAFDAFFRAEVEKWAKVVREAKVRVD